MTSRLRPSEIVDRVPEQDTLDEMLQFTQSHRVLVLTAEEGNGKSTVLSLLNWRCGEAKIPGILVDLRDEEIIEALSLVQRIRAHLKPLEFPDFDQWEEIRTLKDVGALQAKRSQGVVDARGAMISGGAVVGEAGVVVQGDIKGPVTVRVGTKWDRRIEEWTQERCLDAFFRELREHCREHAMVLLLDSYDKAATPLAEWIYHRVVRQYLLDEGSRPERLVVVLASRPEALPDFTAAERELVRVQELERFQEQELVRQFLHVNGRTQAVERDIAYACGSLRDGSLSLQRTLDFVDLIQPKSRNRAVHAGR